MPLIKQAALTERDTFINASSPSLGVAHPKQADFYMTFLIVNFAVKNAMFNLNENNRFVMAQHPSDMRMGVNGMCGQVRAVGLDPTNGTYISLLARADR